MGRNLKTGLVILSSLAILAALRVETTAQIYTFRPGLHFSADHKFREKERLLIEKRLSHATGFVDLIFNQNGTLTIGDRAFRDGSASARRLIEAVVDSEDSFTIESTPDSESIAFAQIESTIDFFDTSGKRRQAWQIRLDLRDFAKLRGSDQTLESFSPVMVLLHELGHGQFRLRDPLDARDVLGECETYVNQIRSELGLPLRDSYVPRSRQARPTDLLARGEQAEFWFSGSKAKSELLSFDLEGVCAECRQQRNGGEFAETWISATLRLPRKR
jgi:hypothetical protein